MNHGWQFRGLNGDGGKLNNYKGYNKKPRKFSIRNNFVCLDSFTSFFFSCASRLGKSRETIINVGCIKSFSSHKIDPFGLNKKNYFLRFFLIEMFACDPTKINIKFLNKNSTKRS